MGSSEAADVVVGIDIGSSKVSTLIGRVDRFKQIEVLGRGIADSSGIKKGCIVDSQDIADAIRTSANQAEAMSGFKILSAYLNLHSRQLTALNERLFVDLAPSKKVIDKEDVERLLFDSYKKPIPEGKCIIDVIPGNFTVDKMEGISDPIGMTGSRLGADADIILADSDIVNKIVRCMETAGINVDGFVVEGLASGLTVLTPEEQLGTVLVIDVGGDMTDISLIRENKLLFYCSVPAGGENITKDVSLGLDITLQEAEELKKKYNLALSTLINHDQDILMKDKNDRIIRGVKVSKMVEIIEARVFEIFSLCKDELLKSGVGTQMISKVVLTGRGISFLDGAIQLAGEVFEVPVRMPLINGRNGIKIEHSVAAGIIKYISINGSLTGDMVKSTAPKNDKIEKPVRSSLLEKITQLFGSLF